MSLLFLPKLWESNLPLQLYLGAFNKNVLLVNSNINKNFDLPIKRLQKYGCILFLISYKWKKLLISCIVNSRKSVGSTPINE